MASTVTVPAFTILYTLLVAHCIHRPQGPIARALSGRVLVNFGSISYALYMYHAPITGFFKGVSIAKYHGDFT